MQNQDFTTTVVVNNTPAEVFKAVLNPRGWWSEDIKGATENLNDVFVYQFEDIHRCKVQLTEVVPDKKVVWHILDNAFNFTKDKTEWINTNVIFEIKTTGDQTTLVFTHAGLTPADECYEACYQGWSHYIGRSLRDYIITGKGLPNKGGQAQTEKERDLTEGRREA